MLWMACTVQTWFRPSVICDHAYIPEFTSCANIDLARLERMPEVTAYARNDHLDFTIPYEWHGFRHEYRPDYLVRWRRNDGTEVKVILEVKGFETEQDRQREIAAQRWIRAVNHHGEFGCWRFVVCKDPAALEKLLREACR